MRSDVIGCITTDGTSSHWFTEEYFTYVGRDNELPVDIHVLYALAAPRHLFISIGENDLASDPVGMYDTLQFAKSVWSGTYGAKVIPDGSYYDASVGTAIISESVGVNVHNGGHVLSTEDWDAYIAYMNEYVLKGPASGNDSTKRACPTV